MLTIESRGERPFVHDINCHNEQQIVPEDSEDSMLVFAQALLAVTVEPVEAGSFFGLAKCSILGEKPNNSFHNQAITAKSPRTQLLNKKYRTSDARNWGNSPELTGAQRNYTKPSSMDRLSRLQIPLGEVSKSDTVFLGDFHFEAACVRRLNTGRWFNQDLVLLAMHLVDKLSNVRVGFSIPIQGSGGKTLAKPPPSSKIFHYDSMNRANEDVKNACRAQFRDYMFHAHTGFIQNDGSSCGPLQYLQASEVIKKKSRGQSDRDAEEEVLGGEYEQTESRGRTDRGGEEDVLGTEDEELNRPV
ncbi:uncharacterized protein B0I36DRAFT_355075 [Microdochium trichocladiopsis]|uniref:Uncharacterized protein n=1 Tax=Microdochium trichocladiopsis TaxID=1682393 RepID=A0A9P9BMB2_9PEZI|nr:uncharacterized protein B0I36DRAFT_355075 [Microdochium trichocladiopsis]KAH7016255.1 hypothetical protein B0I36DRAFT_355075 [Microdochium trichocladiopsis]